MIQTANIRARIAYGVAALLIAAVSVFAIVQSVSAAPLTQTYLRINRMSTGTATTMRLVFRTAGAGATSVQLNMNGVDTPAWTTSGGLVNATQAVSSASCAADSGATALPGTLAASGSSPSITITGVTALAAATTYCVDYTTANAVTTPTSAGEYDPIVTVGADTIKLAVRIVSNDSVVITAAVPPSFNFVLSGNTDTFTGSLSASAVTYTSGVTATVNTNAKNGWIAWIRGANTGLASAAVSKTIAATTPGTSATLAAGTEGYAVGITAITQGGGAGTTSASTAYNALATADGSGIDTTLRQLASSTGTAQNAVMTVKAAAAISALTPAAADYTDTMTIIGAARY